MVAIFFDLKRSRTLENDLSIRERCEGSRFQCYLRFLILFTSRLQNIANVKRHLPSKTINHPKPSSLANFEGYINCGLFTEKTKKSCYTVFKASICATEISEISTRLDNYRKQESNPQRFTCESSA